MTTKRELENESDIRALDVRTDRLEKEIDRLQTRITGLEKFQNWLMGAMAVTGIAFGALSKKILAALGVHN